MQLQEPGSKRRWRSVIAAIKGSLWIAAGVLLYDVAMDGCYTLSMVICPLWCLISLVKNVIWRPGWGIAVLRISMPLLTLAIAMSNGNVQWRISDANAERVIKACEAFRVANGRYPSKLDELVPKYLTSIPPAKYCFGGRFWYAKSDDLCMLWWSRYGFYRRIYDFEKKEWFNLD
jgi:hypothetical protein